MSDLKETLENYLLTNIPISAAMGVRVDQASLQKVVLSAPFSNNINHKKTVFGGSLHAVATLACWSLVHINTRELFEKGVQIVIASSQIQYLRPVSCDFKAECSLPASFNFERLIHMLKRRGKARVELSATILQEGLLCVDYSGVFVVISAN